jgi:hypothetical protein
LIRLEELSEVNSKSPSDLKKGLSLKWHERGLCPELEKVEIVSGFENLVEKSLKDLEDDLQFSSENKGFFLCFSKSTGSPEVFEKSFGSGYFGIGLALNFGLESTPSISMS